MNQFLNLPQAVIFGVAGCAFGILIMVFLITAPRPVRLSLDRRRPPVAAGVSALTQATSKATGLIDTLLRRGGNTGAQLALLDRAGVKIRLQDLVLLLIIGSLVAAASGVLLAGPLLGLVLAVAVPLIARLVLKVKASRRRAAFADQLDDSLQLIASSLRAGHSLLQALASLAHEADEPTSMEFTRIINETRVGRQVGDALGQTAARMESKDFNWVIQAIAINREVGGNLAEVLDGVGHTIRERNQIRRQVTALSAEGKLSAYVLMALPFGIAGFLLFSNPEYMGKFLESTMGYALIGASVVLLIVGALWMRKVVSFKF